MSGVSVEAVGWMARGTGGGAVVIESADLDARRIASAERNYTAVRNQAQAEARRSWLSSADAFRRRTKQLMRMVDDDTRQRVNSAMSQVMPARNAIERITA